mmetsp:Transcript_26178/g.53619  ORF Transcript_26178/g.53619 Transcript_26178/m.53619 type:complete len:106 (-) Transcript_26178:27-344(-)
MTNRTLVTSGAAKATVLRLRVDFLFGPSAGRSSLVIFSGCTRFMIVVIAMPSSVAVSFSGAALLGFVRDASLAVLTNASNALLLRGVVIPYRPAFLRLGLGCSRN